MKRKTRIVYLVLSFIMIFNMSTVYADTIKELKGKQKDVENQIDEKKEEIKDIQKQAVNVSNEIKSLDKKLDEATSELTKVESEISVLEDNITKTNEELVQAEANIEEKQDTFNKRLRVMYKTGNAGYIEILLSSSSISDFLSRQDMLKSIAKHDTELIAYMKEQREIINTKKVELNTQKEKVEISKNKLVSRRRDLAQATRAKEDLMVRLKEDHVALEKEYDSLNDFAKEIESKIVKLQVNTNPFTGGKLNWPVPGFNRISSPFGYRIHPILKTKKYHTGIDIPAPTGNNVVAGESGIVILAENLGGYGKAVMVDHGGGIVTLYAHNSSILVSQGQSVDKGDTIAKIGSTGMSTGPHSHFEVRKNGAYVNPISWLKGN